MNGDAGADELDAMTRLRHELRQPLQALRLLHGALRRAVSDPAVLEMLESQQQAIDDLARRIDALPGGGTPSDTGAAMAAATAGHAGDLVVVVDDDAQIRKAWERLLSAEGWRVACLAGLAELRETLAGGPAPGLVVTDHRLRDGAVGTEVVQAVREAAGWAVPALVITGEPERAAQAMAGLGNCRVVAKPVRPDALLAMVRAACGGN